MRLKIFTIILSFCLVFTFCFLFNTTSHAVNNSSDVLEKLFVLPFEEPQVDGHHGYLSLLLKGKSNGNYTVRVYSFSATNYSSDCHILKSTCQSDE